VAKEAMKIGAIVAIETGRTIADTIKEVAQEVRRPRDTSNNKKLLDNLADYVDFRIINDDD
jgi:hypothetical protein